MKKKLLSILLGTALLTGMASLAGCSSSNDSDAQSQSGNSHVITEDDLSFTNRDKDPSYDAATATTIQLNGSNATIDGEGASASGSTVTISQDGTYVISGSLTDGTVIVNLPGDEDKAQIVLDNASIHNEDGPAIEVAQADKVFLTLADGSTNTLSDGKSYTLADGEDEPYAALFSKDDLTINGSGALKVTGNYRHAIASKDDLVITGGAITITCEEDAVRGNDAIKIGGGDITVTAGDDAFNSKYLFFIEDGNINVKSCYEGIEAEKIFINGGTSNVKSSDDGVNAVAADSSSTNSNASAAQSSQQAPVAPKANGSQSQPAMQGGGMPDRGQRDFSEEPQGKGMNQEQGFDRDSNNRGNGGMAQASSECLIQINGGTLTVDASGDGLDSNGSIEITGGTVFVSGASNSDNSGLDYALGATVDGGNVIIVGSAGMGETLSGGSQTYLNERVNGNANSTIEVKDSAGKVLVSYTSPKAFQLVCASAPNCASVSVS